MIEFAIIAPLFFFIILSVAISFIWVANWVEWHDAVVRATVVGTTQNATPQLAGQKAKVVLENMGITATISTYYPASSQSCPSNPEPTVNTEGEIYICVPPFTASSGDNNGTVSVFIYGWIPSPISIPIWGNNLYVAVNDTETLQVPAGDASQ